MTPTQSEARTRVYRLLARAFRPPDAALVGDLLREDLPELVASLERLGARPELVAAASRLAEGLREVDPKHLARDYESSFEPSGGAERPPNETAHAPETPQEGLTRTFELADIAGFYRAFGVEVEPGGERVDHIAAELEFMHLLAVKQAVAEERGEVERAEICRDAAVAFLRDHLGRWIERNQQNQDVAPKVQEMYEEADLEKREVLPQRQWVSKSGIAVIVWVETAAKVGPTAVTRVVAATDGSHDHPPGQSSYHEHT